ncbi:MAG: hypothetical protein EON58_06475 [Alphaproteobacteria bacterium]|nr:MAG: hypothetical protein EON58_06475 [Alphaproteobacteria bacterium]
MTRAERNKILKIMAIIGGATLIIVIPSALLTPNAALRVAKPGSPISEGVGRPEQHSPTDDELAERIDPDAISVYAEKDRKSYPKLFARLGQRVSEVGATGKKAALLTLRTGRCDRVAFVDVSERATREKLHFYVDCANETRVRVSEDDLRAGVAADFETKQQRDRLIAARAARNESIVSEAQARVRQVLREPGSAIFGPTYFSQKGNVVCGVVNARNGFGGMSGNQRFIVFQNRVVMASDSDLPQKWKQHCDI